MVETSEDGARWERFPVLYFERAVCERDCQELAAVSGAGLECRVASFEGIIDGSWMVVSRNDDEEPAAQL